MDGTDFDWKTLRLENEQPEMKAADNGDDANSDG